MERHKRLPFEAILALVMMLIVSAIAVNGIFIQGLPMKALKYPIFCFSVFFTTCIIEVIRSVRKQRRLGENADVKPVHYNKRSFIVTVGMIIGYVVLMWLFGFIVSSIALTIGFTWLYKVRKSVVVNVIAAVIIVIVYLLFSNALFIFLPKGLLFEMLF